MKKLLILTAILLSSITFASAKTIPIEQVNHVGLIHKLHIGKVRGVISGRWFASGPLTKKMKGDYLGSISCINENALRCNYSIDFVDKYGTLFPGIFSGQIWNSSGGGRARKWNNASIKGNRAYEYTKRTQVPDSYIPVIYVRKGRAAIEIKVGIQGSKSDHESILRLYIDLDDYDGRVNINKVNIDSNALFGERSSKTRIPLGTTTGKMHENLDTLVCLDKNERLPASCFMNGRNIIDGTMIIGLRNGRAGIGDMNFNAEGEFDWMNIHEFDENGFPLNRLWGDGERDE